MQTVASGSYGQPLTSDYVYDETVTLTLGRTDHEAAKRVSNRIRGRGEFPNVTELLFIDRTVFDHAANIFEQYDDQGLSFTDATTIALVEHHDIDHVLSFDDDFDGIVSRLDPADA